MFYAARGAQRVGWHVGPRLVRGTSLDLAPKTICTAGRVACRSSVFPAVAFRCYSTQQRKGIEGETTQADGGFMGREDDRGTASERVKDHPGAGTSSSKEADATEVPEMPCDVSEKSNAPRSKQPDNYAFADMEEPDIISKSPEEQLNDKLQSQRERRQRGELPDDEDISLSFAELKKLRPMQLVREVGLPIVAYYFILNETCVVILTAVLEMGWLGGSDVISLLQYVGFSERSIQQYMSQSVSIAGYELSAQLATHFVLASVFFSFWTPLQWAFCFATFPKLRRMFRRKKK